MENISEFIPLLLIVGSIILSAITGSKKKKKEISHETRIPGIPPAGRQRQSIESLPGSALKKEIKPNKAHISPKVSSTTSFKDPSLKTKPASSRDRVISEPDEESPLAIIDASDQEEVKKAIIYSEIFARKKY
jgi:hypothetical protein